MSPHVRKSQPTLLGLRAAGWTGVYALSLLSGSPASAQSFTWSGGSGTDWTSAQNWIANGVPIGAGYVNINSMTPNMPTISNGLAQAGVVFVGGIGGPKITLQDGGQLHSDAAIIGNSVNGSIPGTTELESGSAKITGDTSKWTASSFSLGLFGTGELTVEAGGKGATSGATTLGSASGATGTLKVSGVGSDWQSGQVTVGGSGTGILTVSDQATLRSTTLLMGGSAHSTGTADVTGAATSLQTTGGISVGSSGTGTLNISNGGTVTSGGGTSVGILSGGLGTLRISGADSLLSSLTSAVSVGNTAGSTGLLEVSGGGKLDAAQVIVGWEALSQGTVIADGAASRLKTSGAFLVGFQGNGTATLSNGAALSTVNRVRIADHAGSTGTLNIGAAAGDAPAAPGVVQAALGVRFGAGTGKLVFNHSSNNYVFDSAISSLGAQMGKIDVLAGSTILTGDASNFSGTTAVKGGALIVNGALGGELAVGPAGTLSGSGSVVQNATLTGGVLQGTQGQTPKIGGNLALDSASQVNVALGAASSKTLFDVGGNLTLGGKLNVSDQGAFGAGVYRLFDYGGTLTGSGLTIGAIPTGIKADQLTVQTALAGQVNLVSTARSALGFWGGGAGVWRADDGSWTNLDGTIHGAFQPNLTFAVFQAPAGAGTVTVDTSAGSIGVTGMQFATDGYRIQGDAIMLAGTGGETFIRVGTGSPSDAGMTGTIASSLTGVSRLTKTDYGTLVLTGANTYTGGTLVSAGTLQGNTTSLRGAIENNATLIFAQTVDGTYAGAMSGTGSLVKTDAGTLTLSGDANHTGGTTISAGTLRVGNGMTGGSLAGNIMNNATLAFERSDAVTVGGNISGAGTVEQRGTGTLTLASANTYSGGTAIRAGALVGSATSFGSGAIDIGNSAMLALYQNTDAVFANALSGNGVFTKSGNAALNLTGSSNAFTGTTDVTTGTLAVNGTLGGSLNVHDGATLKGTGAVGSTTVMAGGIVAPGNSIGTLNVAGDLRFAPGAVYQVEADPNSNASDRIAVSGTAAVAGSVVHVGPDGGFASTRQYTILTANTVLGQFGSVSSNYAFLNPTLRYGAQDITLQLERKQVPVDPAIPPVTRPVTFADAAQTGNQRAVANALDSLPKDSALHEFILTLPKDAPPAAFNNLSGEAHASVTSGLIASGGTVRTLPMSHLRANLTAGMNPGAPTAQASGTLPASALPTSNAQPAWAELVGNWQTLDGNGNAARVKQNTGGLFVGADHAVGGGWRVGGALGYTDGNIRVDDRASKADVSSYSASLFGGRAFDVGTNKLNLLAGVAYTWHNIDTERYANVAGSSQKLTANYGANTTQLFTELGYAMALSDRASLEPFAGLAWSDLRTRGFSESGGSAALSGQSSSDKQTSSTLGLRAQTGFSLGQTEGKLRATLGWRHAFGEVTPQSTMAFDGGQAFTVAGAPIARNAALAELGADIAISRKATMGLNYSGQYGGGNREHAGSVNIRWRY